MKALKRIIIMSKQPKSIGNLLNEIDKINITVDIVDDYKTVKNCTDQINLKNRKIKNFVRESDENFQHNVIRGIEDLNGTTFLINKN